ncbi:hypothetical protein KAU09_02255 [Candidatus Parcubacteria bacterium]|nr:hypothetical protein [Candidatus Parcubacteria bacterium]
MNFWYKYKKLILITAFLAVCLSIGYLLYLMFFKPALPKPPTDEEKTSTSSMSGFPDSDSGAKITGDTEDGTQTSDISLPQSRASEIAKGGLTKTSKLNNENSLEPIISSDGNKLQYYNKEDGHFYKIDKNGKAFLMSEKTFHNVENIVWADTKNKAIIEYPDGANTLYNFDTNRQTSLPSHWKDFNFSPGSEKIVMKSIGLDPGNRWLAVAGDDGSNVRALEPLGKKDDTVYPAWSPNNQIAAVFTESRDFDRQEVYFIGLNKENFKSAIVDGRGFQPKWSPKGDQLLYSVYSSKNNLKPSLWVVNAQGESIGSGRKNLNIETWAEKCAYGSDTELYCAVPENLPEGSGLFPELALGSKDNIYKIDTKTGVKKLIAIPDQNFSMSNLNISENGYYLYFTDNKNNNIHKIKLK